VALDRATGAIVATEIGLVIEAGPDDRCRAQQSTDAQQQQWDIFSNTAPPVFYEQEMGSPPGPATIEQRPDDEKDFEGCCSVM
jgi:hypothetical protein